MKPLLAPFPYFGGKRSIATEVWSRLGSPSQYIEPFCGSAAILLAAPKPATLEVVCDSSGFIANFWRAVKHQPAAVAEAADYPVSHIDLGARHLWLVAQIEKIGIELQDPDWPGDAKVAGWWLWGQCCHIAGGWCDWNTNKKQHDIKIIASTYSSIQASGSIPNVNAGFGTGTGINAKVRHIPNSPDFLLTTSGRVAWNLLHKLANRLDRVKIIHGDWSRCINNYFDNENTAVFLDPPYRSYERLYSENASPIADAVEVWARENAHLRIALCGHYGDYNLPGWDIVQWSRGKITYSGNKTTDKECVWYSPACIQRRVISLFDLIKVD